MCKVRRSKFTFVKNKRAKRKVRAFQSFGGGPVQHLRLPRDVENAQVRRHEKRAEGLLVDAPQHLHEDALAAAVRADDADEPALLEREVDLSC